MNSCIYVGQVKHRRYTPRSHKFNYTLFMMYLDLEELPNVFQKFWLWSYNKRNIASFYTRDHLKDYSSNLEKNNKQSLLEVTRSFIESSTGLKPQGNIRLLTHLSYFGFRFNPVNFYYCFDKENKDLEFIVAEVNNTPWGEQHCYILDNKDNQSNGNIQQYYVTKDFHVSPFMPMDIDYDWRFSVPSEKLSVHMENHITDEKVFDATLTLEKREINHKNMALTLISFPFVTLKVISAIYYQAFLLLLKRIPICDHPDTLKKKSVKSS